MEKHVVATVYIIHKIQGEWKILLHKHPHHRIWIGVGGHVEMGENPAEAAVREAKEETGLDVVLVSQKPKGIQETSEVLELPLPFTILEEYIRPYEGKEAHHHIDCIYFGRVLREKEVIMKEKWGWFSKSEVKKLKLRGEVKHIVSCALKK